jgi:nitrite reductase (NADH) small subunit/3-phenylpropionate/trans-cinnamate dioxygenase ferredoxin subunit
MTDSQLPLFPEESSGSESNEPPFVTVARVGDIPEGQGRAFPVGKTMVAVFLLGGQYFAIDDFCPHQGASLAEGYVGDCTVACPWHHWRFSVRDGSWLDNPKIKVQVYRVCVSGHKIQVQLPPEAK